MKLRQNIVRASAAALVICAALAQGFAAEHVYLRTGSDLVCDHQENVNGQVVRLFLSNSEDNYLDIAAADILRVEPVAIEPASPASAAPISAKPVDLPLLLHHAGAEHHLDPDLLASVVRQESGGRVRVISRAGARGLMQLMPNTASVLGVHDSFAADQNVAGGAAYLDSLLTRYHDDVALALAAYNAGPAAVQRYGGIPPYPETRRYVQRVIHDYNRRKLLEMKSRAADRVSTVGKKRRAAAYAANVGQQAELENSIPVKPPTR